MKPAQRRVPATSASFSMKRRLAVTTAILAIAFSSSGNAQSNTRPPERAIRRDIPMTNTIRRAHAAGTRDSTGRPGRNYWQQWVEYTINARLDAPTSTITGRETILLRNNSDSSLRNIVLRLDQNIFAPNAARATPHPSSIEQTQGMKITRMVVNGQAVNLTPPPPGRGGNPAASGPAAFNLENT